MSAMPHLSPAFLRPASLPLLFFCFFFFSCEDKVEYTRTYTVYEPVYQTLDEIRSAFEVGDAQVMHAPGKIFMYGDYLFVNEPGEGIHVIDNSNKSNPINRSFISLPGNYDIAAKDGVLYADSFMDLVLLDISDINNIHVKSRVENIFINMISPWNYNGEQVIVIDWVEREKVEVSSEDFGGNFPLYFAYGGGWCATSDVAEMRAAFSNAPASASPAAMGGSMARFTLVDHYLYTIDYTNLYAFDIQNPESPNPAPSVSVGWGIETIFPYEGKLFIGAENGLFIYSIANRMAPQQLSIFEHVTSCDPVVVHNNLAYVTLRGGTECRGFTNQLDIINVANPAQPQLLVTHPMQNPHGLGYDRELLFICEGEAGLKVFDASDIHQLGNKMLDQVSDIWAYDVIAYENVAMVIGQDGLCQYDYTDPTNLIKLSCITIDRTIPAN